MKINLRLILLLFLGILVGVVGTLTYQKILGPKQTVNVLGQGEIDATADQAVINLTVTNTSWSNQQAEIDNKQAVQELKVKLIALGIPESRITQTSYNQMPQPFAPVQSSFPTSINSDAMIPPPIPGGTNNLTTMTNLSISLDKIIGVEKIFAAINETPNAKITNTNYSLKSTLAYESKAREKALQDARNQVETVARINHLHVGKLVSVSNGYAPVPMYKEGMVGSSGQTASPVSNSYGDKIIPITATYNILYELY